MTQQTVLHSDRRFLLPKYLGAEEDAYTREIMQLLMLAAIHRVYEPGCKYEIMVCLVGGQGAGKSTFFRFLAIKDEWFSDDLKRMEYTPGNYYNFHPGSHVGQGTETGIAKIAEILNDVLNEEQSTTVLLETMSGKGSEVGATFQELREIIDRVGKNHKLGVCLDTCHVWDGGYDIVHDLDGVLTEFDQVIGLSRLKAVHLNDSMNGLGSHKDRHAKIGEGEIGLDALVEVVCHPALKGVPFILETPNDDEGWKREIALLRERYTVKGA